jgi:hypothetical protein
MKTRRTLRTLLAACLLLLLSLLPTLAHAQLSFPLATPNPVVRPGDTLSFEGTLLNSGASLLFLSGDTFRLGGTGLALDDSPFFLNGPLSLDAGTSFTGELFTVSVDAAAPAQGGAAEGDRNDLASDPFAVTVSVPEPASGALLPAALLALPLGGRATRQRALLSYSWPRICWPFFASPRPTCAAASR